MRGSGAGEPAPIGIDARKLGDFGIGEYLRHLIGHLPAAGPEREYVLFHRGDAPAEWRGVANLRPVRDDAPPYSLREQWSLSRNPRRHGLGLLHLPHYVVPVLPSGPHVVTVHDTIHLAFPENLPGPAARWYARFMLGRAVRTSRRILTVSEYSKGQLMARLGVPEEKIAVIPLGRPPDARPDCENMEEGGVPGQYGLARPFLLHVGNLRMRHKNLPTLLAAYTLLRQRHRLDPPLALCGGGGAESVWAGIERLPGELRRDVRVLGFVPRAHLMALYRAAAVVVCPSLDEGFGLPALEAMGCGTPVVAAEAGALPEVLGGAGLTVPPREPEAFAQELARVLTDGALRETLVRRGLARAAEFSWAEHARRTVQVYREALD
ncbi:MAG: glycosyltransferase family 1 protein [bacterium]